METILSYIENLFKGFPDTPEVQKARRELEGIMEDKYQELKFQGKSENEAIGIVISEFGNMDELAEELGLSQRVAYGVNENASNVEGGFVQKERHITMQEVTTYMEDQIRGGKRIGIGVAICILSVVPAGILDALKTGGFLSERVSESVGAAALFLIVAVAVGIFITTGIAFSKYDEWKKDKICMDYSTTEYIKGLDSSYTPVFARYITAGVILCILGIVPGACLDEILTGSEQEWIVDLVSMLIFVFAAVGVFLFISAGMKKGVFDRLLNKGDYSREKQAQKNNAVIAIIASIYWPIVTVIYLVWSFVTMQWEITWLVWPVAGILFGAIAAVCAIVQGVNKNE